MYETNQLFFSLTLNTEISILIITVDLIASGEGASSLGLFLFNIINLPHLGKILDPTLMTICFDISLDNVVGRIWPAGRVVDRPALESKIDNNFYINGSDQI